MNFIKEDKYDQNFTENQFKQVETVLLDIRGLLIKLPKHKQVISKSRKTSGSENLERNQSIKKVRKVIKSTKIRKIYSAVKSHLLKSSNKKSLSPTKKYHPSIRSRNFTTVHYEPLL